MYPEADRFSWYLICKYDALGRVTEIKYNGSMVAQYQYDELSRRTLLTLGNDANAVYEYDLGDRLKKLTNHINTSQTIDFNYANYDKVGNRKSCKIDSANAYVFTYDKLYQLTFVDYNDGNSTDYWYDTLGNRTSVDGTSYLRNKLNQYTSVSSVAYSYDNNGNLTNDGNNYYYDCENRLTEVNNVGGTRIATYKYDYMGRRVKKLDYTLSPTRCTLYCYDGDQIIADYNESGMLQRKYVYGPGIDEPICMIAGGNTYYYHFDGLGSVVALSNNSGQVVERYSYNVFGEPNRTSAVGNRFMFTGREYDSETGLYNYRARYYKPSIGRFLQTDPVGYYDSMNLYQYCGNNPVNWTDPWGLLSGKTIVDFIENQDEGDSQKDTNIDIVEPKESGMWKPVPGYPGMEVRHDKPAGRDPAHDHYRNRGKEYGRRVDPETGKQRPHGKRNVIDRDIPPDVIDAGTKAVVVVTVGGIIIYIIVNYWWVMAF